MRAGRALLPPAILLGGCQTGWFPLDVEVVAWDEAGTPSELLVADQGGITACSPVHGGRALIVDRMGQILWEIDPGEDPLWGPHNATMSTAGDLVMVSDTCNDRVLVYEFPSKTLLWDSRTDCSELDLRYPNTARFLGEGLDGHLLLTLLESNVVIELNPAACDNGVEGDEISWQYGHWGTPRDDVDPTQEDYLSFPHNAIRVASTGHILIADAGAPAVGRSRVIEVDPAPGSGGELLWSYGWDTTCHDTVEDSGCPGLGWTRDVDVRCLGESCEEERVYLTDTSTTFGFIRDATDPVEFEVDAHWVQMSHGSGLTYDADWLPTWDGDDNGGDGWMMISHNGLGVGASWLRVVSTNADSSEEPVWEISRPER